eukprot:967205-Amphidinium_carterae.1
MLSIGMWLLRLGFGEITSHLCDWVIIGSAEHYTQELPNMSCSGNASDRNRIKQTQRECIADGDGIVNARGC